MLPLALVDITTQHPEFRGHLHSAAVVLVPLLGPYALTEIRKRGFALCEYSL